VKIPHKNSLRSRSGSRLFTALLLASVTLLSGCASTEEKVVEVVVEPVQQATNMGGYINEVSQAMADQLIRNTDLTQFSENPVAITSFVNLENFEETSRMGEIIAENMVHELQVRGHKVIDFKMMPYIRVTESGDFVRSREIDELMTQHNINVVLTGTYVFHSDGLVINARMMEFESGVVVSSAQSSIPGWYVNAVEGVRTGQYEQPVTADVEVGDVSVSHNSMESEADMALAVSDSEIDEVTSDKPAGFSRDLQALDDLLFNGGALEAQAAESAEEQSADFVDTQAESGRYLCSPQGICFDRQKAGLDTESVAQL